MPLAWVCLSKLSTRGGATAHHGRTGELLLLLNEFEIQWNFLHFNGIKCDDQSLHLTATFIVHRICVRAHCANKCSVCPTYSNTWAQIDFYWFISFRLLLLLQVALRRQQTSQDAKGILGDGEKIQSVETLLAQKRDYQKHLRSLQQTSIAKNILQGKQQNCVQFYFIQFHPLSQTQTECNRNDWVVKTYSDDARPTSIRHSQWMYEWLWINRILN